MSSDKAKAECRIYVGNLPPDIRDRDVEDLFTKYGKITFVDVKARKGPPFAFVEFEDRRDAEDAVRGRDGYYYDGYRLRVEFPKGKGPRGVGGRLLWDDGGDDPYFDPRRGGGDRDRRDDRGGGGGFLGRGAPPGRRTGHRCLVTGLPPSGSWQDLKDHMREAGDVTYADVFRDGSGVVEFQRYDDMKYAIKKLDDTKFRSHEGETSYVRVQEDKPSGGGGGSSRRRSRSRSRSPVARRRGSPSYGSPRGRSRSGSRSASRSVSRSRSRSR